MRNTSHSGVSPLAAACRLGILGAALLFGSVLLPARGSGPLERILAPVESDAKPAKVEAPAVAQAAVSVNAPRQPVLLTGDVLVEQLRTQILEHFSIDGELKLELSRPWKAVPLPADDVTIKIIDYGGDSLTNSLLLCCAAVSGGQKVGEWQVGLRAQLWKEVWVASTRLDRGQPLDSSVLGTQKVDLLREREALMTTDIDPTLYDLNQSVAVGRPLSKRDVTERPLIHKNQIIEAVARRGALAVSLKAQALENGVANALIKVRNLDSEKVFSAQVLDENRVEVQF